MYWTTFDDAQAKTKGSCPIHENEYTHPKKCSTPAAWTPLDRATPKAENTSGSTGCIYPSCEFGVDRPTRFRDMDYAIFPH